MKIDSILEFYKLMKGGDLSMLDIKLKSGKWLYANCADTPSEKNCQMVMMAPVDQKDDFVKAAVTHMVETHGHEDTPELRNELENMAVVMEV